MSIKIIIKEVADRFYIQLENLPDKGLNRVLSVVDFKRDADPDSPEGYNTKIDIARAYANGISDGMNAYRSMMPTVTWSGQVEPL